MKTLLELPILAVVAGVAWMAGASTHEIIIRIADCCPAVEAFEPPADPGLTAPGWDDPTLDLMPDQGEA